MRKYIDCREHPGEVECSLKVSGTEDEVLNTIYDHAIKVHGEKPSLELRAQLRGALKDEEEPVPRRGPPGASPHQAM